MNTNKFSIPMLGFFTNEAKQAVFALQEYSEHRLHETDITLEIDTPKGAAKFCGTPNLLSVVLNAVDLKIPFEGDKTMYDRMFELLS